MNILLVTKQGSIKPEEAKKLRRDLKKMGYRVAMAYLGAVANVPCDVNVIVLPK